MSTADKLKTVADNVSRVYAAGQRLEKDRFWDVYQQNGNRTNYEYAFAGSGWMDTNFFPKYDIILGPGYSATSMFWHNEIADVPAVFERAGIKLDFSNNWYLNQTFQGSMSKRWGIIDASNTNDMSWTFASARVEIIEKLILSEKTTFYHAFNSASKLTEITIEGIIGQNGFDVSYSPLLTHASLMSIISALKDYSADASGTAWVVALGETNLAKLTDTEKAIATEKGWTLA